MVRGVVLGWSDGVNVFWVELAKELANWRNAISPGEEPEIAPLETAAWLLERMPEGSRTCREWMETGLWPKWTHDLRWQIALRLALASRTAQLMAVSPMTTDRGAALQWLLIDLWEHYGPDRVELLLRALKARR